MSTAEMIAPSSNDAQDTFLEGIGMLTTDVGPLEEIQNSGLLTIALSHIHCGAEHISDCFYNGADERKVLRTISGGIHSGISRSKAPINVV